MLRHTADVAALGYPVLQALSRKDFVGESLDLPPEERLEGSLAATAVAAWLGATVFRAHDVRATRRVVDMVATIRGNRPPRAREEGHGTRTDPANAGESDKLPKIPTGRPASSMLSSSRLQLQFLAVE